MRMVGRRRTKKKCAHNHVIVFIIIIILHDSICSIHSFWQTHNSKFNISASHLTKTDNEHMLLCTFVLAFCCLMSNYKCIKTIFNMHEKHKELLICAEHNSLQ